MFNEFPSPRRESLVLSLFIHGPSFEEEIEKSQTLEQKANVVKKFLHLPSNYGFGCKNEAIKMLSGFRDEEVINRLDKADDPEVDQALVKRAIRNMGQCLILLMDSNLQASSKNELLLEVFGFAKIFSSFRISP